MGLEFGSIMSIFSKKKKIENEITKLTFDEPLQEEIDKEFTDFLIDKIVEKNNKRIDEALLVAVETEGKATFVLSKSFDFILSEDEAPSFCFPFFGESISPKISFKTNRMYTIKAPTNETITFVVSSYNEFLYIYGEINYNQHMLGLDKMAKKNNYKLIVSSYDNYERLLSCKIVFRKAV